MIVLSNTTAQTLTPGQSIAFDKVVHKSGNAECHRMGTGSVKLKMPGVYAVDFSGNISSTVAGTPQLVIELGGDPLNETTMKSTPAATGDFNNVSTGTKVRNCCGDYDRITVTNNGTIDVVVDANSNLRIGRLSC